MSIIDSLESTFHFENNKYGIIVIIISILTRIFVVSIAWSYGLFILALKKSFPDAHFSELGWIGGLAQGLGSIISPIYLPIVKKLSYRITFTIGLLLCFVSLLASSFVTSEHYLFFTYSLPFGIGSSILFVLGSLLTGTYFPPSSKYHILATVGISLGSPLGFLVMNPLTNSLLHYYENDWQTVKRIYSVTTFFFVILSFPFFTEKFADKYINKTADAPPVNIFRYNILFLSPNQVCYLVKTLWLTALLFNSCANNSILINLNGFVNAVGKNTTEHLENKFIVFGISDTFYRVLLSGFGHYLINNLSFLYILSAFVGMIVSIVWTHQTFENLNTIFFIIYAICPAVLRSLMYSVSSEINGEGDIQSGYTQNVMFNGFGIILGPILSGYLLDKTAKNYKSVFILAASYYAFALACYVPMKLLLIKNWYNNKDDQISRSEYTQFENENDPVNQDGTNNHFNNHNTEQENYEKNESSV